MNNWRLLLLAVVAVFQPIASFTDHNLIDGRQQCCDRLSPAPLQDTRSSLHGTYRLVQSTSAQRRLNDQNDIREDRRYELRQRVSIFSRPSTEGPVDIRGRVAQQDPSEKTRSSRTEHRQERVNSRSRERQQREETARFIRDLKPQDLTRRVVERTSRDALETRNDRVYTESPRARDDYRAARFGNERLSKKMFDREMQKEQLLSDERRIILNRDERRIFSRTQDNVPNIEASTINDRQRNARERLNIAVVRRESTIRPDTRHNSERNNERRVLQRSNEQRRSLKENTRLEVRDMSLNTRNDNRENRLSRERTQMERRNTLVSRMLNDQNTQTVAYRRENRIIDRLIIETREGNRENLDQRLSSEKIHMDRRNTRESRMLNAQNNRNVADRRESRINERLNRETRDENRETPEQRLSRGSIQMERRNIRESRMLNAQNNRNVADRRENRIIERLTRDTRDEKRETTEQRLSRERIQMERRTIRDTRMSNAQNNRNVAERRENKIIERLASDTRDENRETADQRLSRESIQMERRNIRESRMLNAQNNWNVADRRENRIIERLTRDTRDEKRETPEQRLSRERIQMERRNIRDTRMSNAQNNRNVAERRENKINEKMTRETREENRENLEQRLSRERISMDRRNIRESRIMNVLNSRNVDQRQNRNNERMKREVNPEQKISRERIQMDRRNTRESDNRSERDVENRSEIRTDARLHTENRENPDNRLSRESTQMERRERREELRGNLDRRLVRENRQGQRNSRESRVNRVATRYQRSIVSDAENQRETRNNERLSAEQIRGDLITSERRMQSRAADRVNVEDRDRSMMDRRARSADRRNFREIRAEPRLSRSIETERRSEIFRSRVDHSHKIENREREAFDARSRNVENARNPERTSVMVGKLETENEFTVATWQYVLYTLQAAYLCTLFMQMLTPSRTEKAKKMSLHWLPVSSHYDPIKVD